MRTVGVRGDSTMMALMSAPANDAHHDAREQQDARIQPPAGDEAEPVDQGHRGEGAERRRRRGTAHGPAARVAIAITAPSPAPPESPSR